MIEEFDYTIEHRPGKNMRHVDALSRNPISVLMIEENSLSLTARIGQAQQEDEDSQKIRQATEKNRTNIFSLKQNILYRNCDGEQLLVIPKSMQHDVIREAHERGHFGWKKN